MPPFILVVPDYRESHIEDSYSLESYYLLRKNYLDIISQNSGLSFMIPYSYSDIEFYLQKADGILLTGAYHDINPIRYNPKYINKATRTSNEIRESFEFFILENTLKKRKNMPILGICSGMQIIAIYHKSSLIQNIPDNKSFFDHEQKNIAGYRNYYQGYHDITIDRSSKLFSIIKQDRITTNSSHHQAIEKCGDAIKVTARSDDGIIESIEVMNHDFCIGIQWHPEFNISSIKSDTKIFSAFVKACENYAKFSGES